MSLLNRKQVAGLILSTLVLGFLIYLANVERLINSITSVDNSFIVLGFVLGVSVLLSRSLVWFIFLNRLDIDLKVFETFRMFSAGEFMNNITPLGQAGGQPFMAYVISKNAGLEYEKSLTTVVSADIITGTPLVTFTSISVLYFILTNQLNHIIVKAGIFSLIGFLMIVTVFYLIKLRMNEVKKHLDNLFHKIKIFDKWEEKIKQKAKGIEQSFKFFFENRRGLIKPLIFGHIAFLTEFLILSMFLIALGAELNLLYLFIVFPLANISKSAPTSGGSGVYEFVMASLIVALSSLSFSVALTATILYRLTTYWNAIIVGYIALQGLTYSRQQTS